MIWTMVERTLFQYLLTSQPGPIRCQSRHRGLRRRHQPHPHQTDLLIFLSMGPSCAKWCSCIILPPQLFHEMFANPSPPPDPLGEVGCKPGSDCLWPKPLPADFPDSAAQVDSGLEQEHNTKIIVLGVGENSGDGMMMMME